MTSRPPGLSPPTWAITVLVQSAVSLVGLLVLTEASFGKSPVLGDGAHVFFGEAWLFVAGLLGAATSSYGTFRALSAARPLVAVLCVVFVFTPCLIFSLCQLWAWAMFVGWA